MAYFGCRLQTVYVWRKSLAWSSSELKLIDAFVLPKTSLHVNKLGLLGRIKIWLLGHITKKFFKTRLRITANVITDEETRMSSKSSAYLSENYQGVEEYFSVICDFLCVGNVNRQCIRGVLKTRNRKKLFSFVLCIQYFMFFPLGADWEAATKDERLSGLQTEEEHGVYAAEGAALGITKW